MLKHQILPKTKIVSLITILEEVPDPRIARTRALGSAALLGVVARGARVRSLGRLALKRRCRWPPACHRATERLQRHRNDWQDHFTPPPVISSELIDGKAYGRVEAREGTTDRDDARQFRAGE